MTTLRSSLGIHFYHNKVCAYSTRKRLNGTSCFFVTTSIIQGVSVCKLSENTVLRFNLNYSDSENHFKHYIMFLGR